MRKAILTKPLDGKPEGAQAEFANADFDELEKMGAVKAAPEAAEKVEEKVSAPSEPETKSEPAPANKMEVAPGNKAATTRTRKPN